MSKKTITPVAAIVGAALVGGLSAVNIANAAENPFAASQLDGGYLQLASEGTAEGKCGEGKCGEGKSDDAEGKCGEGKCGEGMDMGDDTKEGKCGEGKCGGAG